MRIIFMGSGKLACPAVKALLQSRADEVLAVVTQPDRPSGRSQRLTSCPVKAFVQDRNVRVLTPERVSAPDVVEQLAGLKADLIVVADYGQFLKPDVLALPPKGCINIHPSLLPKYRGAAPIQWAIANGDRESGVTVMFINEQMDAGDIIAQEKYPIRDEDTAVTLEPVLAEVGASLLLRVLEDVRSGTVRRTPQDVSKVVLAPKLKKEDGRLDWVMPASELRNRIRGFVPWPGCFCEVPEGSGHMLRVLKAAAVSGTGKPGTVIQIDPQGPVIACAERALRFVEVQPEGKKVMSGSAYLCGHKLMVGEILG